jgi:hypothetical protein
LPLLFMAKGSTDAADRAQIGGVAPHWLDHLTSG